MTLTGVGCRLQTSSRLASERFDSAFCALNFDSFMPGVLFDSGDLCQRVRAIDFDKVKCISAVHFFCDNDLLIKIVFNDRRKCSFRFLLAAGNLCVKDHERIVLALPCDPALTRSNFGEKLKNIPGMRAGFISNAKEKNYP